MKRIGVILYALTLQLISFGAFAADNPVSDLRALVNELELEHMSNVQQLMSWHDSLLVNKRMWQSRYDSLYADTLALTEAERYVVELDAALFNYTGNPSLSAFLLLKGRFASRDIPFSDSEKYVRELLSIMLECSIEQNDYSLAYSLSNRIHAQNFDDWKKSDERRSIQYDSLVLNQEELNAQGKQAMHRMSDLAMQWHIAAVVSILLLLIAMILLIVLGRRWKRQRLNLSAKANDTSEEEALVHKLEEARREIVELKLLAKKKVEVIAPPVEVPQVPTGSVISASDIAEWNDQIQQALVKIKGHCEAGKGGMSVPTYMSIVNDTTRLSSQVAKKSEQWIALLQSK
jgi:hypothetical protein